MSNFFKLLGIAIVVSAILAFLCMGLFWLWGVSKSPEKSAVRPISRVSKPLNLGKQKPLKKEGQATLEGKIPTQEDLPQQPVEEVPGKVKKRGNVKRPFVRYLEATDKCVHYAYRDQYPCRRDSFEDGSAVEYAFLAEKNRLVRIFVDEKNRELQVTAFTLADLRPFGADTWGTPGVDFYKKGPVVLFFNTEMGTPHQLVVMRPDLGEKEKDEVYFSPEGTVLRFSCADRSQNCLASLLRVFEGRTRRDYCALFSADWDFCETRGEELRMLYENSAEKEGIRGLQTALRETVQALQQVSKSAGEEVYSK